VDFGWSVSQFACRGRQCINTFEPFRPLLFLMYLKKILMPLTEVITITMMPILWKQGRKTRENVADDLILTFNLTIEENHVGGLTHPLPRKSKLLKGAVKSWRAVRILHRREISVRNIRASED
jgi:hypothetical protein